MGEGEFWIRKESLVVLIVDLYDVPILLAGRIVSLCKSNSHIKIILHRFCTPKLRNAFPIGSPIASDIDSVIHKWLWIRLQ